MRARKPVHIGKNIIGQFPSLKMKRMIWFESTIERDFIYILEYDSGVVHFEEQPLTIEYATGSKFHKYTPDFKIETVESVILVDCKPESEAERVEHRIKFDAAAEWCEERAWDFQVVTDRDIREGNYLANVKTLVHHCRRSVASATLKRAEDILSTRACTLRELATLIDTNRIAAIEADLLCLAFHRRLTVDVTENVIDGQSQIGLGVRP